MRIVSVMGDQKMYPDFTELSIEELMNIEVTVASRKAEKVSETAAAVYVLRGEEMVRAGVTKLPDALRMVPGVQVAQIDANKWAITARGFNTLFANKLLVLMDGRSIYSPMFSGVFWEAQDVLIRDVDRIEVVKGPGATLWGANAVNGIINIITKPANETQGGLLTIGGGLEENQFANFRYGHTIGNRFNIRVYSKYFKRDEFISGSGDKAVDGWEVLRAGFRSDWMLSSINTLTFQGDLYNGKIGQTISLLNMIDFDFNSDIQGGHILGRWTHTYSNTSDFALQIYFDRLKRGDKYLIGGHYSILDIDYQHRVEFNNWDEIVWGLGYRYTIDKIMETPLVKFEPDRRRTNLFSAFFQDELTLKKDQLILMIGSKFEHNDYSGFEIQPNFRCLWKPKKGHTLWSAVSRAVRTPSRYDHDIITPIIEGNSEFESEELLAYELGYNFQPISWALIDIAGCYNRYENLQSFEPKIADNKRSGITYGGELALDIYPSIWWHIRSGYTYLKIKLQLDETSQYERGLAPEGESPRNQVTMRSYMDLPYYFKLDVTARYVDHLSDIDTKVPSYIGLDIHLGWHGIKNIEFSLVGQNLLLQHHPEFSANKWLLFVHSEIERTVFGEITWTF